jgi:hypothetical protein
VHAAVGNGGNILIDPNFLILERSRIVAQAVEGHGGNITIVADNYLPSADSVVSASSQLGVSGAVEIVGPRVDLNGSLVVLPSELREAVAVLRNSCAARSALPQSSLTGAGRGGLPQDPEASVPALYLADREALPAGRPANRAAGGRATHVSQLRRHRLHLVGVGGARPARLVAQHRRERHDPLRPGRRDDTGRCRAGRLGVVV